MSPRTKSPFEGADPALRPVSQNPAHYRSGRWWLLGEGVLLVLLGCWGLASNAAHPHAGPAGAPVAVVLSLTAAHSGLLLGGGIVAVLATVRRRPTVIVTGAATLGLMLLFTIGVTAATAGPTPGPLGLDLRDAVLHAVLLMANLALLIWLLPDALGDPAWVVRRRRARSGSSASQEGRQRQRDSRDGAVGQR
jgi:hypothetical protein